MSPSKNPYIRFVAIFLGMSLSNCGSGNSGSENNSYHSNIKSKKNESEGVISGVLLKNTIFNRNLKFNYNIESYHGTDYFSNGIAINWIEGAHYGKYRVFKDYFCEYYDKYSSCSKIKIINGKYYISKYPKDNSKGDVEVIISSLYHSGGLNEH